MKPCSFTLVELMIAISLLTLGLVGVLGAFAKSADTLRRAQDHLEATSLAKREMGKLEFSAWRDGSLPGGSRSGEFGDLAPRFSWRREVQASEQRGMQEVTVVVIQRLDGRQVSLSTRVPVRE